MAAPTLPSKAALRAALRQYETPPRWTDTESRRKYLTRIAPMLRRSCRKFRIKLPPWLREEHVLKSLYAAASR